MDDDQPPFDMALLRLRTIEVIVNSRVSQKSRLQSKGSKI